MSEEHFRRLENLYHGARCNEYYSPSMQISRGSTELIIPIKAEFFHAAGATHGSVYFKALDDTAFFAANSLVEDLLVLTANFNIHLLRPIASGELRAVGKVVNTSSSMIIAESVAYNSEGREIARGSGTFVRSKIRLTADIGYKF